MRQLIVVLAQTLQHPSIIESKLYFHDSIHFLFVFIVNPFYLLLLFLFRLFLLFLNLLLILLYSVFVPLFVQSSFDNFFQVLLKSLDRLRDRIILYYSFTIRANFFAFSSLEKLCLSKNHLKKISVYTSRDSVILNGD